MPKSEPAVAKESGLNITRIHIDELDPPKSEWSDEGASLDMDNWRNYTASTDAWEEFKVGHTYRNKYYKPRPYSGKQSSAKFYTHPPGQKSSRVAYIRTLGHH